MIYDCFTFFNENDLLDIRLNTLNQIVDKFIIIEADKTHSGEPKPFYFDKKRFAKFKDKIIYIPLSNVLVYSNSWQNENIQRNYILEVLKQEKCNDDDVIIITDLDEIPNINAIKEYLHKPKEIYAFQMNIYNYFLNLLNISEGIWTKGKILRYRNFKDTNEDAFYYSFACVEDVNQGITPTKIRMMGNNPFLENMGWHFTYMGGIKSIQKKLQSFGHQEFNTEYFTNAERIERCLNTCQDILDRHFEYKILELNNLFPEYLVNNKKKFAHLLFKENISEQNKLQNEIPEIKISNINKNPAPVNFYWQDAFLKYIESNNIVERTIALRKGMDSISKEYIDNFIRLIPFWNKTITAPWTKKDEKTDIANSNFLKTFQQPFPDLLTINPYFFSNIYGLIDLPKHVFNQIDGKIIIDGGGLNGDTALMFHKYFPNSEIHVYEPISSNINIINKILEKDNCNNKIIPIKMGLGKHTTSLNISYNSSPEMTDIDKIDNLYKNSNKVGLIKLDTEGFETLIIEGSIEIIKRDKPILVIAIYHTPQDFFELKDKIKNLNMGYKFLIRRSEMVLPQADLVLIAY